MLSTSKWLRNAFPDRVETLKLIGQAVVFKKNAASLNHVHQFEGMVITAEPPRFEEFTKIIEAASDSYHANINNARAGQNLLDVFVALASAANQWNDRRVDCTASLCVLSREFDNEAHRTGAILALAPLFLRLQQNPASLGLTNDLLNMLDTLVSDRAKAETYGKALYCLCHLTNPEQENQLDRIFESIPNANARLTAVQNTLEFTANAPDEPRKHIVLLTLTTVVKAELPAIDCPPGDDRDRYKATVVSELSAQLPAWQGNVAFKLNYIVHLGEIIRQIANDDDAAKAITALATAMSQLLEGDHAKIGSFPSLVSLVETLPASKLHTVMKPLASLLHDNAVAATHLNQINHLVTTICANTTEGDMQLGMGNLMGLLAILNSRAAYEKAAEALTDSRSTITGPTRLSYIDSALQGIASALPWSA